MDLLSVIFIMNSTTTNDNLTKLDRTTKTNTVLKTNDNNKELNFNILKWFRLLIKQLEFYVDVKTGRDKLIYSYKLNSIRKAYRALLGYNKKIDTGSQVSHLKGIGKGTVKRIDEILDSGVLSEVNEADISGAHLEYVEELMKIFGIGRVKAYELYTVHNIKSISDLKKAINSGLDVPRAVKVGLKYIDVINTKIPREKMVYIYSKLIIEAAKIDLDMGIRVCGSYRRESNFSGDIDVIVSHPKIVTKADAEESNLMVKLLSHLKEISFIVDSFTSEDVKTKYMGLCSLNEISDNLNRNIVMRIDIRYMPQESYHTAILYFTGSADFNVRMRNLAIALGYTLNEYALIKLPERIKINVTSEKDIFDTLHMEYQKPRDRY